MKEPTAAKANIDRMLGNYSVKKPSVNREGNEKGIERFSGLFIEINKV